jgi:hypothetical protein
MYGSGVMIFTTIILLELLSFQILSKQARFMFFEVVDGVALPETADLLIELKFH